MLILVFCFIIPLEFYFSDTAHEVEVNEVKGRLTQIIFRGPGREIHGTCMKTVDMDEPTPQSIYQFLSGGARYAIKLQKVSYTYTEYDPEVMERPWWPIFLRRGIRSIKR